MDACVCVCVCESVHGFPPEGEENACTNGSRKRSWLPQGGGRERMRMHGCENVRGCTPQGEERTHVCVDVEVFTTPTAEGGIFIYYLL